MARLVDTTVYGDLVTTKTISAGTVLYTLNGTGINEFSIDGTFAGNSDDAVPTEKAVKTYSDSVSAASVEADRTHKIWSDTMFASVSAASDEADNRLEQSLIQYVDGSAGGGGEGFSNKIVEGDSGVTVNDEGTGSINISADGTHVAQFKSNEMRLMPEAAANDRIYMGTPSDKTGGYFEVAPSASLSPSGTAPLQYNGYFYATKVYNAVWG